MKKLSLLFFFLLLFPMSAYAQSLMSSPTVIVAQRYVGLGDLNGAVAAAVTAAGGGKATVWIAVSIATTGSLTVASNINFEFTGTGAIVVGSGHTLTYNGSTVGWPLRQLVSGAGSFVFGINASGEAFPQWWGGNADGANNFTLPLRATLAAVSGSSGIKTIVLRSGIYLVNFETTSGAWVGVPTGIRMRGDGYGSEIRGNAASLAEGEAGTLVAIEGNNVTIDSLRINGNKAGISGLTTYSSFGLRIATAAANVVVSHVYIHSLPASSATEAAGIITNTSGAVSNVSILESETWDNNGTGVIVNGDYEQGRNTSFVFVFGLYTHDNTWNGISVLGARDVRIEGIRSENNTLECASVGFALRTLIMGGMSRCRNGIHIRGDSHDTTVAGTLWGSNKSGSSRGQVAVSVGTWGAGQNTKAIPGRVDLRNAEIIPTPGDYHVWIDDDATVSSFNDTGTFSVTSNVITRSVGSWNAGLLVGQVVELSGFTAVDNIRVRIQAKTSTQLTVDPLYGTLVDDTGTGDEAVFSTFASMPQQIQVNKSLTYRVEDFAGSAVTNAVGPYLTQETLNETVVFTGPVKEWLPSSTLSVAAFSGTGNQSSDAITLTGTANTATLSSPSFLEPGGVYLLRIRYRATATGKAHDWRVRASDGATLPYDVLLTGDSTVSASQWREASARVQVGTTPAFARIVLLSSATSTIHIDWITIARLPEGSSRPSSVTTGRTFQGWVTSGAQTLDLGVLPANCVVTKTTVTTTQAFDSSGTDVVTIGYTGNTLAYLDGVDVGSVGIWDTPQGIYETVGRDLKAYYVNGGGEPTQGKALVTVRCDPVTVSP